MSRRDKVQPNDPFASRWQRPTAQRVRRTARTDLASGFISNFLSLLLSGITGALIARALGPSGKGTVSLLALVATQLAYSMSLGVEFSVLHYGGDSRRSLTNLAGACLRLAVPLGAAATALAIALLRFPLASSIPPEVRLVAYVGMAVVPLLLASGYLSALLRASGRIIEAHISTAFFAVANFLAVVITSVSGATLFGFVVSASLGLLAGSTLPYVLAWRAGILPPRRSPDEESLPSLVAYGLKGHLGTVLQGLNYRLDVFIVASFLSARDVGLYTASVAAAEALWIIPNVLGFVIINRSASTVDTESKRLTATATRLTSGALIVGAGFLLLFGRGIVTLVYGEDFVASYTSLACLLPGIWALGIWKNVTNDLVGRGYPWARSQTAAAAVLVTIVLDLVLIPAMGVSGAAVASSAAYCTAMMMGVARFGRITGTPRNHLFLPTTADLGVLRTALHGVRFPFRRSKG